MRPTRFGIAVLAITCTAITIDAASGTRVRSRPAPRIRTTVVAVDARHAASAPSTTGEWSEIPLDARGRLHVVAFADGYADCGARAASSLAPSGDDVDLPAPWSRSPRPDVYVDVGGWARSRP